MDEDQIFIAEAIRDTATHNSTIATTGEFTAQTIIVQNGLDETVAIQLQGSRDETTWYAIDAPFNVTATTDTYETVTDYFPCYRTTAVCTTSPTTGSLDIWILKSKG